MAIGNLPTTFSARLSRTHYTLTRCGCGRLLYLSPAPTDDDLRTMYVDERQFGNHYTDEARVKAILEYIGGALGHLERHVRVDSGRPLRVLEIGAGLSWMCRAAKGHNADSLTVAQDVSPEAVESCPWVDHYFQCDVGDGRLTQFAPYDIVSLTHVIEHLIDPVGVVAKCARLMGPNGVLFITAPHRPRGWNEEAPDLDVWTGYSHNHVPAHVQYFSRESMARLAQASGCELVYWSDAHEGGEAFEAWLSPSRSTPFLSWIERTRMFVGRKTRRVAQLFGERP